MRVLHHLAEQPVVVFPGRRLLADQRVAVHDALRHVEAALARRIRLAVRLRTARHVVGAVAALDERHLEHEADHRDGYRRALLAVGAQERLDARHLGYGRCPAPVARNPGRRSGAGGRPRERRRPPWAIDTLSAVGSARRSTLRGALFAATAARRGSLRARLPCRPFSFETSTASASRSAISVGSPAFGFGSTERSGRQVDLLLTFTSTRPWVHFFARVLRWRRR